MTKKILFVIGLMMATVSGIASNVATEQNSGRKIFLYKHFRKEEREARANA